MSVKDFSHAWDEAAQCALENSQTNELTPGQLSAAAGLRVRSGLAAGVGWIPTDACTEDCTRVC